jgi:hypothetical protein
VDESGVKQLDGKGKWNITTMSRVVSLLYEEEFLFLDLDGEPLEDLEDLLQWDVDISERKMREANIPKVNVETQLDKSSGINEMSSPKPPNYSN